MNRKTSTVSVTILDKEYQVACPPEQQAELLMAARHLDEQMRLIRETGKVIGLERIAVMAALNISHELLSARSAEKSVTDSASSGNAPDAGAINGLNDKLDRALHQLRQMEIG